MLPLLWQDAVTLETSLLAVLATLVGALIWVTKALFARSERLIEVRDAQIARALDQLEKSISTFGRIEAREDEVHGAILSRIEGITVVQRELVEITQSVLAAVNQRNGKGE